MKPVTLRDYKERLLRVLVYIQQHLDEPLALETLAARACLSPYHFHRVFTGMIGESLQSHIRRLRLERAAGPAENDSTAARGRDDIRGDKLPHPDDCRPDGWNHAVPSSAESPVVNDTYYVSFPLRNGEGRRGPVNSNSHGSARTPNSC